MSRSAVTHTGDREASSRIRQIGERGSDIRGASSKVRTVYREAQQRRWASQGFGTWPALKPSTVASKQRAGEPRAPMRASGALMRSMTAARARDQVDERTSSELVFGTTLPYAAYHEQGNGVPKRSLVDFPAADERRMAEAMRDYITEGRS